MKYRAALQSYAATNEQSAAAAPKLVRHANRTNGFPTAAAKAKSATALASHGLANGLVHAATRTATKNRGEIPMDGDFRDF